MNKSIYKDIFICRNGTKIPVLNSGKTIESKYNPENSLSAILATIKKETNFFIVLGKASGLLLNKLLDFNKYAKIICVERTIDDFDFLNKNFPDPNSANSRLIYSTLSDLYENILNHYLPSLYGNLQVIPQQNWIQEQSETQNEIQNIITLALKNVSEDYSVQCHFGKLWQKNILNNLKFLNKTEKRFPCIIDSTDYSGKKAAIIAAGPSLDNTIVELLNNRNNYVIFSTDTAYQFLLKKNIEPDFVISIDGQYLSYNHYFNIKKSITKFLFDLSGNYSAVSNVRRHKNDYYFFISGHPFSSWVNNTYNLCLPEVFTGSGTVTIAALNIAIKSGFTDIEIFGADFSYLYGKSYVKGTYLDRLYSENSSLLNSTEKKFDHLLFRAPLKQISINKKTTAILESYKNSLEQYLLKNNCIFKSEKNKYIIQNKNQGQVVFSSINFDYDKMMENILLLKDNEICTLLLPLIANIRYKHPDTLFTIPQIVQLARSFIVSYN